MRKKYKITAFSRILIFLVFFLPFAYLGASYYNEEDGIENIKRAIDGKSSEELILDKKNEIAKHSMAIQKLNREIEQLKEK